MTPVRTQHYIPCWGFRMEADGRRLAYTADTAPCDGLSDLATDADLLLSEATLRTLDEDAQPPEPRGHITPAEAGDAAREGGSRRLVLTHLMPRTSEDEAMAAAARSFAGPISVARPGLALEI